MDRNTLIQQLKALGEPTRLSLAVRVARREWGGGELLEALNVSQPSLSRHVRILREAGLLRERRDGRNVYYRLLDSNLAHAVVAVALGERVSVGSPTAAATVKKHKLIDMNRSVIPERAKEEEEEPKSSDIEEWLL